MLPKAHRLTRSADFAHVRRAGRSRAHPLIILSATPNNSEMTRVGISVGKKVGKAVARNRAKRLLREAMRMRIAEVATGQDIVLIGRSELAGKTLHDVSTALDTLLRRARLVVGRDGGDQP